MTTIPDSPSTHEDSAQTIRYELQRQAAGIRGFTLLTAERRRRLNLIGRVDEDFLRSMALLLEAHPDVARAAAITAAEVRDHLTFSGSYQGVGEELMLHGRKMTDTLLAERSDIGARAMRALKVARDISVPSERAALIPHLEAIEREFARGRRKRAAAKKAPEEPETAKKEDKP